jgi:hypothetical protein
MILLSTIRPAPGADGPFFVTTEQDQVVFNVTTGVQTLLAALNQARDDQSTAIQAASATVLSVTISTRANP